MAAAREGLGGSDADESARDEERPRKADESRSRQKIIRENRDDAALMRANAEVGQTIAEQSRLSVGAADAIVGEQYSRFKDLMSEHIKLLKDYGELQRELAEEKAKDRETRIHEAKIEAKTKKKKQKEKSKRALYEIIDRQLSPMVGAISPQLPVVAAKLLPIGLDFAVADGATPRDAMTRLLKRMFDEKDETGHGALVLVKSIAEENGPNDWMLIQAHLVAMATSMPDTPVAEEVH